MGKIIEDTEARVLELNILKNFARFCEENQLRYYLAYGTLLGAVRHAGFIPWDNDVDVAMPRPDYEKFIKLTQNRKIGDNIDLLLYDRVRTFPFVKLVDNRTKLKEHFLVTENSLGVYIDVFPLDGMPSDVNEQEKILKKSQLLIKVFNFANSRFNTGANFVSKAAKNILYPVSKMISNKWICKNLNSLGVKYSYDDQEYVGNIVWGWGKKDIMKKEWFETTKLVFENCEFDAPKGYHEYLSQGYGEYMELPPEADRVVHAFEAEWK